MSRTQWQVLGLSLLISILLYNTHHLAYTKGRIAGMELANATVFVDLNEAYREYQHNYGMEALETLYDSTPDAEARVVVYSCAYSTWDGESCNCAAPDEWFERECR